MNSSNIKCLDWQAWHDQMPGSKPILYVTGKCVFPTPGYSVKLEPVEISIDPPEVLELNRIVEAPTDLAIQVLTEVEVRYSQDTDASYQQVNILPENVTIPVREVS